jgi:8-hydroxy-5-deazaflavin:NADPH oxidoreductase
MRIAILGAGTVGQRLASKLRELGHDLSIGTRNPRDAAVSYAEAAEAAELVVIATSEAVSLEALDAAGAENLSGKVLIDVSNPLDFSKGMPPTLIICNDDSVGEQIQRAQPHAKVVKALNTVNNDVMVNPSLVPGEHVVFVCGNDDGAKAQVVELLGSIGWPSERIVDLGDISNARGPEMYVTLWIGLMGVLGTPRFNIVLAHA